MNASEQATAHFYQWESLGRGYYFFDHAVDIEPPYRPFRATEVSHVPNHDDGKVPSLLKRVATLFEQNKDTIEKEEEPSLAPIPLSSYPELKGISISFKKGQDISAHISTELLNLLSYTQNPISFEIRAKGGELVVSLVSSLHDIFRVQAQIRAYFPEAILQDCDIDDLGFNNEHPIAIADFGLQDEFMRPIKMYDSFSIDSLTSIIATLDSLKHNDTALLQIIFKGVTAPWEKDMLRSVSDGQGGSFFSDDTHMLSCTQEKTSSPLFSVVTRIACQGNSESRSRYIASELARNISTLSSSNYNRLIPLSHEGYPYDQHLQNVYDRTTNRLGMILSSKELVSLVHYPNKTVVSTKLGIQGGMTKQVPFSCIGKKYQIGTNIHNGKETIVSLNDEMRLRHTHIIGATGTGKSTLIATMILEDIRAENGCVLFDPHGDIVEDIMARIPENRLHDVILIDPSDTEYPIGFNLLQATSEAEKIVLSSDLVSAFARHATAWGDQMTSVLSNAINAFLDSKRDGTLIELKRFLLEKKFREQFLASVEDPAIQYYWKYEFPMLKRGSLSPLLTRIDTFLRPKIIRSMLAQTEGVNFKEAIENKKIVLIKLSQGLIGEENSYLLASIFLSKLLQTAQGRQNISKAERHPYYVYLDEFQNFLTLSITQILSGARKYGLGLVLAHQELSQIEDNKILGSVLSNPYIRVCFRMGDVDSKKLASGFSGFEQEDFQSLAIGQAIMRAGSSNDDFNVSFNPLQEISKTTTEQKRQTIVEQNRKQYAKSREEVDRILENLLPQINRKETKLKEKEPEPVSNSPIPAAEEPKSIQQERTNTQPEPETPEIQKIPDTLQAHAEDYIQRERSRKHRSLQNRIRTIALKLGYHVQLEEQTQSGGKVDVGLTKNSARIAIEISVTNTTGYEVHNLHKCLSEGYDKVYMLSENQKHLANIQKQFLDSIGEKKYDHVFFMHPDQIKKYLESIGISKEKKEKRIKGWKVNVND